jgi:hypothetical protein
MKAAKLFYKHRAIGSLTTLARVLDITPAQLRRLVENADKLYHPGPKFLKADGTVRETWDAHPQLKAIQGRIKNRILLKASYPEHLQGGLKKRDYVRNAKLHTGSKIVINEDIANFFPSITAYTVQDIWQGFFHYPEPVASCLTKLTTRYGELPQGAKTSTHLANLVFWRSENQLVSNLRKRGIRYSRFVDDITLSAKHKSPATNKTYMVGTIFALLSKHGFGAKRSKHSIMTSGKAMSVNKLVVNRTAGLPKKERARIRAAVSAFESLSKSSAMESHEIASAYNKVRGRVELLKRFHKPEAEKLLIRLDAANPKKQP